MRSINKFSPRSILAIASLAAAAAWMNCGGGAEVAVVRPVNGEIQESFTEPAKTRLDNAWTIRLRVDGRIERVELKPGDAVKLGQTLAVMDTTPFELAAREAESAVAELQAQLKVKDNNQLEETAKIEAEASIQAGDESLKAADKQVEAAKAVAERAAKELERLRNLSPGMVSQSQLDDAELSAETTLIDLRKQEFYRSAFNFIQVAINLGPRFIDDWLTRKALEREVIIEQLTQAQTRLERARHDLSLTKLESPIDGVVLERYEQGPAALAAGTPLLRIGDLDALEIEAEALTQDAMRLHPGSPVELRAASQAATVTGKVKRIEPAGFTKLSSLGVEQQRVRVIVELDERPEGLGVAYHMEARFITSSKQGALIIPRTAALQAPDGTFYVFAVKGGKLVRRAVKLGLRSDLTLEVLEGVSLDDMILKAPDSTMRHGDAIKVKDGE
ncbi:HlyD family efflux transporter periplasmic adaptor subunit [Candidatus Sumerlaeota bacterium]|nr:HlyD family efflux transporter periplasmic adaptor subunit [Candidatus Sumerlaeota bacterium]